MECCAGFSTQCDGLNCTNIPPYIRRSQTICQMFHSLISYFIHAEIQLLEFQGPSQGRGQEFTGMRGYSTARQPYGLQPAVSVTQPLHKLLDSIVTDSVVSEVQLPQRISGLQQATFLKEAKDEAQEDILLSIIFHHHLVHQTQTMVRVGRTRFKIIQFSRRSQELLNARVTEAKHCGVTEPRLFSQHQRTLLGESGRFLNTEVTLS
ncbi:hypothetical protein EYF80_011952 [Liparis tanakae]|uniref:Uncharacterized protein n=1 Tax=Liparis tanakae TaxID=230148 RepID=A0A4Z2IJC8_9TELE|nr:hypothetical protein EYF80_011952 [Liparis tanakae]